MKEPKFSIITPVHVHNEQRGNDLLRAIKSLELQTYKNFELIIINDGSTMEVDIPKHDWIKTINQPHNEWVIAYNKGFKKATGDWL